MSFHDPVRPLERSYQNTSPAAGAGQQEYVHSDIVYADDPDLWELLKNPDFGSLVGSGVSPLDPSLYHPRMYDGSIYGSQSHGSTVKTGNHPCAILGHYTCAGHPARVSSQIGSLHQMLCVDDHSLVARPDTYRPDCPMSVTTSPGGQSGSLAHAKRHHTLKGITQHSSITTACDSREKKRIKDSNRIAAESKCYNHIYTLLARLPRHVWSHYDQCDISEDAIKLLNDGVLPEQVRILKDENSRNYTLKRHIEKQRRALKKGDTQILREIVFSRRSVADSNGKHKLTRLQVLRSVRKLVRERVPNYGIPSTQTLPA